MSGNAYCEHFAGGEQDDIGFVSGKLDTGFDETVHIDKALKIAKKIVYTGSIDEFFGYKYGTLEYRSIRFETETLDIPDFQGNPVVNYTERDIPYTRIVEHKHFEFGRQPKTVISREYPLAWQPGIEPFYPVNDDINNRLYLRYRELADGITDADGNPCVIFGGRLGQYKYFDMDNVIEAALDAADAEPVL